MLSSLVAPHGSTSRTENMNMNAFKKTLVAIAAVATLGATGLAPPRLPPDITTAMATADTVAGMATASPPTAITAIPPTAAIPLTATATSPTATATAAAEGLVGFLALAWSDTDRAFRAGVFGRRPRDAHVVAGPFCSCALTLRLFVIGVLEDQLDHLRQKQLARPNQNRPVVDKFLVPSLRPASPLTPASPPAPKPHLLEDPLFGRVALLEISLQVLRR